MERPVFTATQRMQSDLIPPAKSQPAVKIHPMGCRDLTNPFVMMGFWQFPTGRAAALAGLARPDLTLCHRNS